MVTFKQLTLVSLLLAAPVVEAAEWVGRINLVVPCNDEWFEVGMIGKTASWNGNNNVPIRFMFKKNLIGVEKYRQLFLMMVTAQVTDAQVWIGSTEAANVYTGGANCNTNNAPGQSVHGASLTR